MGKKRRHESGEAGEAGEGGGAKKVMATGTTTGTVAAANGATEAAHVPKKRGRKPGVKNG